MINRHPVVIAAVLLGMFAVVGTTLVSFTYENTRERIIDNERKALLKKLHQIIPADYIDNDIVNDTIRVSSPGLLGAEQTTVYRGRKLNQPVAAVFSIVAPEGYSGSISMLVAVKT
ncbi:MAG: electron transporter RnfG, partial [Gammaproteobacteria bacterium]|nr:electron transporter RnfG [Gammaproteobacteria bacterium]